MSTARRSVRRPGASRRPFVCRAAVGLVSTSQHIRQPSTWVEDAGAQQPLRISGQPGSNDKGGVRREHGSAQRLHGSHCNGVVPVADGSRLPVRAWTRMESVLPRFHGPADAPPANAAHGQMVASRGEGRSLADGASDPGNAQEALGRFCALIPARVRPLVSRYPEHQWQLLWWFARTGPAAEDLAASTPALAFMLALSVEFSDRTSRGRN
jgi:hypothetical protein